MQYENRTRPVNILLTPGEHTNLKKNLQIGQTVSSFIRDIINNELERLETYNKEKNQTWDIE